MKTNRIFLALTLGGLVFFTGKTVAQDQLWEQPERSAEEQVYDSVQTARHEQEVIREQKADDVRRMDDIKDKQRETKAIAKETRRVDREASNAARQARLALRAEKKAQKARKDADKQSRDADRAKIKSDKN